LKRDLDRCLGKAGDQPESDDFGNSSDDYRMIPLYPAALI
jgi:hypothetical protein